MPQANPFGKAQAESEIKVDKTRPIINNPDGSFSTVESFSFNEGGKEILIPSIVDGNRLSQPDAINAYREGNNPAIGFYDTPEEATRASKNISKKTGEVRGIDANPFGRNLADENPFGKKQPPQTDRFGQAVSDNDLQIPKLQRSQSKQGRLSSAGGSFARGFGDIIASLPKAVGEGAVALANKFGDDPIWGNPDKLTPEDTASYQMGESIEKWFNKFAVNPQYSEEFWSSQIPQGAGSMVGFLAGGAAGRAAGIPALVTTMGLGATATGVEGVDDYLSTLSKDETADPKTREQALYWNSLLGTSEALPITRILSRLDKVSGGGVKKILTQGVIGGMEELTQEVLQSVGQNAVASDLVGYDPDRGLFTGTVEAGEVGFTLGFLLNTLAAAIGSRRAGRMRDRGDVTGEGKIELPDMQAPIDAMDAEGVIGEEQPEGEDEIVQQRADDAPPLEGFEDGGQDQTGAVPGVGGTEGLGPGIVPAEEAEAAVGEINYFDNRLKRDIYRGRLKHLVDEELVPGGGVDLIPDHTALGGESDPRDDQGRPQAPLVRTPSLNPDWYQALMKDSNYTLSVEKVRKAATKAVEGDRLGVKQARVVGAILDHITEERVDAAAFAREQLRVAREARTAAGLPEADDWYFEDDEYPDDFDGISRAFTELLDQAQQLDAQLAEQVEAMMESSRTDAEVLAGITQLIGEYNGRKSQAGAETLQAAQEQAAIQGPGPEPLAGEPALPEPGEGATGRRPAEPAAAVEPGLTIPPIAPEQKAKARVDELVEKTGSKKFAESTASLETALDKLDATNKRLTEKRTKEAEAKKSSEGVTREERKTLLTDRRRKKQPGRKQERRQVGSKERRKEWMHRKEVEEMEPAERKAAIEALRQEVMIDPLTGLGSRAAWEAVEKMDYIGAIDADSLKFVNDALGEKAGDEMLRKIGKALKDEFNEDAFHPSGDEFKVHGDSMDDLVISLGAVQDQLKSESVTGPDGTMTGLGFSWGIATTEEQADREMKANKQERTDEGLRVERGERPAGVVLVGEEKSVKEPAVPKRMYIQYGKQRYEVESYQAASEKLLEVFDKSGVDITDPNIEPIMLVDQNGGEIGDLSSMDGRIFPVDNNLPGQSKPLFVPVKQKLGKKAPGKKAIAKVEQLFVEFGGKRYPVESYEDASKKFRQVVETTGIGSRELSEDPKVLDSDGNQIGYISYNGRVWSGKAQDWKPGMKPLYSAEKKKAPGKKRTQDDVIGKFTQLHNATSSQNGQWGEITDDQGSTYRLRMPSGNFVNTGKHLAKEILDKAPAPSKKETKAAVDKAAHEAATSPKNGKPEPTDEQKEAGNYKKGPIDSSVVPWLKGLKIMIENPAGSKRRPQWKAMKNHYGYFQGTEAFDGDEVDVFIGTEMQAEPAVVHVVDQIDPKTGKPDEHKVMLGFKDEAAAKSAYMANYQKGWKGFSRIQSYPYADFKDKLTSGFFKNSTPARKLEKHPGIKPGAAAFTELKAFKRDDGLYDFMAFTGRKYKDLTGFVDSQVVSKFGGELADKIFDQPVKKWITYPSLFSMADKTYSGSQADQKPVIEVRGAKGKQPTDHALAAQIADSITKGENITWKTLFSMADKAYGGSQAEGQYTPKDAYDAMEMGLNLAILDSNDFFAGAYTENHQPKQREALNTLYKMMERLPTQTKRTEEQAALDQYSTPPLHSFMAAWVANLKPVDVVLEPSAGTGNLAVHALKAGVPNKSIYVNELSDRRADILDGLFDNVTRENASYLNATLPKSVKPTVVIMNPPFSADVNLKGKKDQLLGAKHVEQALNRLEPGGRLVAILGRGMEMNRTRTRPWWEKIKAKYNVRANIQVSGEEYRKFGTSFDNQFVVIDKTSPAEGGDIITGRVESVADLLPMIGDIRDDRTHRAEQPSAQPDIKTEAGRVEDEAGRSDDLFTAAGATGVRAGAERPAEDGRAGDRGDGRPVDIGAARQGDVLSAEERKRGERDLQPAGDVKPATTETGATAIAVDQAEDDSGVLIENADVTPIEIGTSSFDQYQTPIKIAGAKPHPSKLAESAAMSAVKAPDVTYVPHIPRTIITSGKLSDVQLESIARAGQAHGITLPDGNRKGFFIGDGTGVGKGAQVAGIIIDNLAQGRKKAVWVSENQKLFEDAKRDMHWVGGNIKKLFQHSSVKGDIKPADGVLFTTYDTLRSKGKDIKDASGNIVTEGQQRIDQVISWLGEDFDGVIAFDEAHNMANALDQKGKRGIKKASMKALAGIDLQKRLPNARIVYVSATGATEVENLGYAERLGLWGEGTPFPDKATFVNEIKAGGVAAMEVVAKDLKSMGVYTSRSLSYDDVEYSTIEHPLTENQRFSYDELATAWQVVLNNVNEALQVTGAVTSEQTNGAAKSAAYSAFWGSHQRFFNQVLTGMQMPSVIDDIEIQLADDKSVVLQLVNTNEAVQERRMNQAADAGITLDEIDITPRDILMQYVTNAFPVNQYEQYTDEDDNVRSRPVKDSQGNHIINPDAVEMREQMLDRVGALEVPEGPLEQVINMFGSDAVAEITGRKRRLVRQSDGTMKEEKLSAAKTKKDANEFMAGKKRILIFSDAGGTGRSYHASNTVKNQQQRIHYLVQPGWRADKAVQGTGRTHRTNQANAPHYKLVTTDIKAQRRFISTIARRLDQLGALTKGQRDTTSQGMFSADMNLESEYGEAALQSLITDLNRGKVEDITMADFIEQTGIDLIDHETGSINESKMPTVPKFLNRLLSMTIANMDQMFMEFYTRLEAVIEYAKEEGTYDSGMETVKADKIRKIDEQDVPDKATKYVKTELENPAVHVQFNNLPDDIGFARHKSSGKLFAFTQAISMTDRSGDIVKRKRRISPAGGTYVMESEFLQKYDEVQITDEQARTEWDSDLSKLSPVKKTTKHLITGELLSIWDRLPSSQPKIIRMTTDEGEMLLGREIKNKDMPGVLKALGLTANVPKKTPAQWMAEVIDKGATLSLSNGWQIVSRRVSGEKRIEIVGASFSEADIVKSQGGFSERIAYQSRLFLPTDDVKVFERVISNKPVIDVFYKGDELSDSESTSFSRQRKLPGAKRAKGVPVAEARAIVERFKKSFDNQLDLEFHVYPNKTEAFGKNYAVKHKNDLIRGAYYPKSNTVALIASDLDNAADALYTLRHEVIGHHGLNLFTADAKREILEAVSASREAPSLKQIWTDVDKDYSKSSEIKRAEEVIARIAQNKQGVLTKAWAAIVTAIRKALRAIGLIGNRVTKAELRSLVNTMAEGMRRGAKKRTYQASDEAQFARAYHGTPHRFDEFKTDKIGTGEGAQAYGYGLYFAESPGVADSYINAGVSNTPAGKAVLSIDGIEMPTVWNDLLRIEPNPRKRDAINLLQETQGHIDEALKFNVRDKKINAGIKRELENMRGKVEVIKIAGYHYEVDIPDSAIDNMLDWDAPLSEQAESVQKALAEDWVAHPEADKNTTGGQIYHAMMRAEYGDTTTPEAASAMLNALGIPGIKYFDQQSRGQKDEWYVQGGERPQAFYKKEDAENHVKKYGGDITESKGTRNLVIFDESIIDVISRNDDPMFSRTEGDDDTHQRQQKINNDLGKGQVIDKVFRTAFQMAKIDKLTGKAYERAVHYLTEARLPQSRDDGVMSWMNSIIETARHGLIDRYGLEDDYIQREFIAEADKRKIELQAMDILTLLDKRGVNNVSEAQVLQAVLTGEAIPTDAWAELSAPIRDAIDQMGQEARDLGLISKESYERNKGSYLHRVYRGHESQQTRLGKWTSKMAAGRRKKIRGDELKGRGMDSKVTMSRLLRDTPPEWWGRKLKKDQADKQLHNKYFHIFDLEKAIGQGTEPLIEGGKQRKARTVQRVYWPADLEIPKRFGAYNNKGKWLVRDIKGDNVVLWRDFTKEERENMGEILDSRYTIAKTFMLMAHDLSTGRFLKDIAGNENWATRTEPDHWENPRGSLSTYANAGWIKVPETNVAGTKVKKWGALAGMYVRAEIWRDLNELERMQTPTFWKSILTQWKLNKTARNPVVHMNNIMSNMIFMDMADIRWRDLKRGIYSYIHKDEHYKDAQANGAFGASYIEHEIRRDILDPILQELLQQDSALRKGAVEGWLDSREWAAKMSVFGKIIDVTTKKVMEIDKKMVDVYQLEDEIFRMATYMRRLESGDPKQTAARIARDQFLNYDIRAPWVNAARQSFLPFIAYTYRAVPVIAKSISERPWKIAKYATLAYVMNMMGYLIDDGDEDEERRSLNERVQGRTWLGTPRLIRMPWSDNNGSPVFLDIRRWIPAGDVFDMNQNQMPLPAWIQFGGPLMLAGEFALNKQAFTGKEIVNPKTDTAGDKASKYAGWAWRSWMPAHPLIPGSWYWDKISTAATGGRDPLGRAYDVPMAALSSLGIKLAPQDVKLGLMYKARAFRSVKNELNWQMRQLKQDYSRNLIDVDEFEKQKKRLEKKMETLSENATEVFGK